MVGLFLYAYMESNHYLTYSLLREITYWETIVLYIFCHFMTQIYHYKKEMNETLKLFQECLEKVPENISKEVDKFF